jgi:GntR family transcriptional repressor for pyruvate dehydrogenase complex
MRDLLEQIVRGELEPGDMLPRELDLAERYGISRGVARECIRGLEERRMLTVRHGRGATITDPDQWDVFDPDVLAALLAVPEGEALIADALECQRLLEVEAVGLSARRAEHAQLELLAETLREMSVAAQRAPHSPIAAARYREARLGFHRAIVRGSGNRALAHMSEPLYRALASAGPRAGGASEDFEAELEEYERILGAVAERDEDEAKEAMDEHLRALAHRLQLV